MFVEARGEKRVGVGVVRHNGSYFYKRHNGGALSGATSTSLPNLFDFFVIMRHFFNSVIISLVIKTAQGIDFFLSYVK